MAGAGERPTARDAVHPTATMLTNCLRRGYSVRSWQRYLHTTYSLRAGAPQVEPEPEPQGQPEPQSLLLRARRQARERWTELQEHEHVLALMASTALMMSGHGILTPVLPLIAENLGATATQLGMSISAFAAARLILNVPLGIVADRSGRRVLLVAGPVVNAAGMAGSGWATSVPELVVWRLIAGAGNAAYLGGAQMYLNDISTPKNRGAPCHPSNKQLAESAALLRNGSCACR